jgi:hypothetical protein
MSFQNETGAGNNMDMNTEQLPTQDEFLAYGLNNYVSPSTLDEDNQFCPICRDPYHGGDRNEEATRLSPCNHVLGHHCLREWFENLADNPENPNECPYCRTKVFQNENDWGYDSDEGSIEFILTSPIIAKVWTPANSEDGKWWFELDGVRYSTQHEESLSVIQRISRAHSFGDDVSSDDKRAFLEHILHYLRTYTPALGTADLDNEYSNHDEYPEYCDWDSDEDGALSRRDRFSSTPNRGGFIHRRNLVASV